MEYTEKLIKTLNEIIFILHYSTANYLSASEDVEDSTVKESLLIYSRERSFYQLQLQDEIKKLEQPDNDDCNEYLKQKNLNKLNNSFSINSFLSTCIATEEQLVTKYKLSLQEIKLDHTLSLLLQNQLSGIEKSLIQIKQQQSLN